MNAEQARLVADAKRAANWKRWGPYLSERQWGTVREDYSRDGTCWEFFPHDHARSRAYRWGEDGLLGITDRECRLCFALALWNGKDPILKERLFGLTGPEGNHGEDVKEEYFYLDSTPTHSYMRALYKYPQTEFPYARLVEENQRRGKLDPEFELTDTAIFDDNRYFDLFAEYAKDTPDDILIRITVVNRGPEEASLHLLPTLWFRNTWSWNAAHEGSRVKPLLQYDTEAELISSWHESLGTFHLTIGKDPNGNRPAVLLTENETNTRRLWNVGDGIFAKDGINEFIVRGIGEAVKSQGTGTKAAVHYLLGIPPSGSAVVKLRLASNAEMSWLLGPEFDKTFDDRIQEAKDFYSQLTRGLKTEERDVVRQAYAGLLWSKQFYHYILEDWLDGDRGNVPPEARNHGRNVEWQHLYCRDVISMPDKWEYPWFAAWDLAFHMIPFARIDPEFAKSQLLLFLREWYMHPNGQIPAYEFALGDVNPPVHAWAAWRVYKISACRGQRDRDFLESVFQKLLLNFTWWVNRKDVHGKNLFSGGFLGLDNIGVFDRSKALPTGGTLQQADGTAWMAFYCATMLSIALELAKGADGRIYPAYEDMASKFLEHFIQIADAINNLGGFGLWDDEDGFYYDQIRFDHTSIPLKVRSLVGLLPLITAEVYDDKLLESLPGFYKRLVWFRKYRADLARRVTHHEHLRGRRLIALPSRERLKRMLGYLLDENEFLSLHGIRSVSKVHEKHPYEFQNGGVRYRVSYEPAESQTALFGGNSNWRGPVWLPLNYLIIEALERYDHFYGDDLQVECPSGSGNFMTLGAVSQELARRLAAIFLPNRDGERPCNGNDLRALGTRSRLAQSGSVSRVF
jgi:hypothetical protein